MSPNDSAPASSTYAVTPPPRKKKEAQPDQTENASTAATAYDPSRRTVNMAKDPITRRISLRRGVRALGEGIKAAGEGLVFDMATNAAVNAFNKDWIKRHGGA